MIGDQHRPLLARQSRTPLSTFPMRLPVFHARVRPSTNAPA